MSHLLFVRRVKRVSYHNQYYGLSGVNRVPYIEKDEKPFTEVQDGQETQEVIEKLHRASNSECAILEALPSAQEARLTFEREKFDEAATPVSTPHDL